MAGRWWQRGVEADEADLYPALEYIEEHVRRLDDAQRERSAGLDQRGGVLLGFSGILISLVARPSSDVGLAQAVAGVLLLLAAGAAAWAIIPRFAEALDPWALINKYAEGAVEDARVAAVATLAQIYEQGEERLAKRARRIRVSTGLVLLAAAALVLGAVVQVDVPEVPSWMHRYVVAVLTAVSARCGPPW